jgi:uncharacterized membrane protein YfcA
MSLPELSTTAWILLMSAAVLVGFAKTALGGVATVAVALFALALPPRESTGALLPLLLVGDLVAIAVYRRHGSLTTLVRLLPGVLPGLALGACFLWVASEDAVRLSIGAILLAMTGLHLWHRRQTPSIERHPPQPPGTGASLAMGTLAGIATMTANAAGAVMTIYLIMAGLPVLRMLGTGAWFFLVLNLLKVPFSVGLSLISPDSLALDAALVPAMLVGAAAGALMVRRMKQPQFELAALVLGALSASLLLP